MHVACRDLTPFCSRVVRTIKEEVIWLNEFETFEQTRATIGQWIENDYNKLYVHSTLGYMSSEEFEVLYNRRALMMTA